VLIVALIVAIWWRGAINPAQIPFPPPSDIDSSQLFLRFR
jgi:amino acid efflux transporter